MKIKSTAQLFGVGLGTALGSLALMSAPAFSATLNFFGTNEGAFVDEICTITFGDSIPDTCERDLKIGEVQGLSQNAGNVNGLQSVSFGKDGSNSLINTVEGTTFQDDILVWLNGETADWELDWDPETKKATFTIGYDDPKEVNLSYEYKVGEFDTFNSLGLITFVKDKSLNPISELTISNAIFSNGETQSSFDPNIVKSEFSDSSLRQEFNKLFFILDGKSLTDGVNITNLTGTYTMSWDGEARSPGDQAAGFQLFMFDPDGEGNARTTPEPGLMLGLLGVGTLGLVGRKRKMEAK